MPSIEDKAELALNEVTNQLKPFGQLPRGDLYVKFDVLFPEDLTAEKKAAIA